MPKLIDRLEYLLFRSKLPLFAVQINRDLSKKSGLILYLEKFQIARCKIHQRCFWKLLKKQGFLAQLIAISAVTKAPNSGTIRNLFRAGFRFKFKL